MSYDVWGGPAYPPHVPPTSFDGMRTYHDLNDADRSGLPLQIAAQRRQVAERLAAVGQIVAVMRGKGGGGESYVTAPLPRAVAPAGRPTGGLDAALKMPPHPRLPWVSRRRL